MCHCVCVSYQGQVGLGDGAVLEAAVSPAGSGFIEGDTKSPTCGEIQLMTEPVGGEKDDEAITLHEHDVCELT